MFRLSSLVLLNEAFGRVEAAGGVARVAIRPEELVALHRGPTRRVIEGGDDAALRVGQGELRAVALQRAQQPTRQEVVVHGLLPELLYYCSAMPRG